MSSCGDVGVVVGGGGARGFVGGGCVGFLHGHVFVFVAKEWPIPPLHRPWPLLLPTLPAERCETSTFSLLRRHLPVHLPVTQQHNTLPLRKRLGEEVTPKFKLFQASV